MRCMPDNGVLWCRELTYQDSESDCRIEAVRVQHAIGGEQSASWAAAAVRTNAAHILLSTGGQYAQQRLLCAHEASPCIAWKTGSIPLGVLQL